MAHSFSRRSFIKSGTALAGLASLTPAASVLAGQEPADASAPAQPWLFPNPGRIVVVEHPGAVLGFNNVNAAVVQAMFDEGIMEFTGIRSSPADALASLFPGLTTAKKIALKPNFLNSTVPTRKELAKAVITRLVQMLGGFPAANISFYERHSFSSVGYSTAYFGQPVNLVYDASFPNLGYTIRCNGKDRPYSRTLHEADYLINMPVCKDHSCSNALNLTLAFKNHMGTCDPGGTLGIHCDKVAVLDIMASSVITSKQRLCILDALYAIYNGGPGGNPQATPNQLLFAQDPVTLDAQGRILINQLRAQNSLGAKAGSYIDEAASPPRSIGIADPALMTVIRRTLPVRLTVFTASLLDRHVHLAWSTESERVNAGFIVQRRPGGGGDWVDVGRIEGHGTTSERNDYRFIDAPGALLDTELTLEYRLRQVDFDGSVEDSIVATVRTRLDETRWLLDQNYPNPFVNETDLPVWLPHPGHFHLAVHDIRGACVATLHDGPLPQGAHYFRWSAHGATPGIYLAHGSFDGGGREIRMILTP